MHGSSRSPDFTVCVTTPSRPPLALFAIDTDSTLVYHHSHIRDLRPSGTMHTLKRTVIDGVGVDAPRTMRRGIAGKGTRKGVVDGGTKGKEGKEGKGEWRYMIQGLGMEGKKLLEVSTTRDLAEGLGGETRLVFRGSGDGELDALRLRTKRLERVGGKGRDQEGLEMVVVYQGSRVGEIVLLGSSEKPGFRIEIGVAGVDPLLFVVLALVVDDRWMGEKRRYRQEFGRGFRGIGKGPGAGLAAAFAL
jgi:hypothetical protein